MRVIRTPESLCPYCGYVLSAADAIDDIASPSAGDLTLCLGCAATLQFDNELKERAIEPAELTRILLEQSELAGVLANGRKAILELRWKKGK